jgi:hypothetical protein
MRSAMHSTSPQHWFQELVLLMRQRLFQTRLVRPAACRLAVVGRELPVAVEQVPRAVDPALRAVALALDSPARPPLAEHSAVVVAVRAAAEVEQTQSTQ